MGAIYVFTLTGADMSAACQCGRRLDRRRKLGLVAGPRACKISIDWDESSQRLQTPRRLKEVEWMVDRVVSHARLTFNAEVCTR